MNDKTNQLQSALQADPILEEMQDLLTDKAKAMFNKPKVKQLIGKSDSGEIKHVTRYFGVKTYARSIGVVKLASIANQIAEQYQVVGVLAAPIQIELVNTSLTNKSEVFSCFYIALSPNDAILAETHEFALKEDVYPHHYLESLDDIETSIAAGLDKLDPKVEEELAGTIHYRFRMPYIHYQSSHEVEIEKESNRILHLLPDHTEYLGAKPISVITTLCIEYHLKFRNDIFITNAELKDTLVYRRSLGVRENHEGDVDFINIDTHNAFNFDDFIQTPSKINT